MASLKEIKRRISSVKSTGKVTRAMEMVAAAKMRRATDSVISTRTYANLSWGTILNLARNKNLNTRMHPLLAKKEKIKRVAIVLMASNRGLCGGFNTNILSKVHNSIIKHHHLGEEQTVEADFVILGKKGVGVQKYYGYNIVAEFPKNDLSNKVKEVVPIANMLINDFLQNKYDKVIVAYTDFISVSRQEPRIKQLLPIDLNADDEYLGIVGGDTRVRTDKELIYEKQKEYLSAKDYNLEYTFEPTPAEVFDEMIPRLIEVQLYQALLESNASEHSARMQAMHQATEAANELVGDLTLFYNKTRQAAITNEIAEISAGANALS